MIKKINFTLILVASICSIYFAITMDNSLIMILKNISIIITINGLYIINRVFKLKIREEVIFIYVLFIFVAHFLGVNCELYNCIYWFDKFVHFISGIVSSFGAIYLLILFKNNKNIKFDILFIIAITLMVASTWEVFEYLCSCYLGVDPQKVVLTGVSDTMGDIIVAYLGSVLVSICYYFEIKFNYNLLIKKYIKSIKKSLL